MLIDLQRIEIFNETVFVKIKSTIVENGLKLKLIFCFIKTTHVSLNLDKIKFGAVMIKAFKYGDGAHFEIILGQTLNHSVEFCNFVQSRRFVSI
jgi:hypothetical protein